MKYLVLLQGLGKPSDFGPYEADEASRVWELYTAGTLKEIYLMTDHIGAVILLECADRVEAERLMHSLPMFQAGLFDVTITSLGLWPEMTRMLREHNLELPEWWPDMPSER